MIYECAREGSSRTTRLWMAPELGYVPVRMIQYKDGERRIQMELKSIDID